MAARLRRSRRNIPPPAAPTEEEKFENLISYATNNEKKETLREFHMPTHILEAIVNNPSSKISTLENLPLEIGMKIQDELTGNDLIMLALTSKTMTAKVEACTTRKIANISFYFPSNKDASKKLKPSSTDDDEWRVLGFNGVPAPVYKWGPYPWDGAREQCDDLRRRLHAHLGPTKYCYCSACRKFRPKQKQFWRRLIEYENPGISKGRTKAGKEVAKQVTKIVDEWAKHGGQCPVHALLKEIQGVRSLKA